MRNFKEGELEIKFEKEKEKSTITWLGKSKDREPAATLDPYFEEIIKDIKGGELLIDFSKLEYMNSSTVSSIVKFIKMVEEARIPTKIQYDINSKWQSASFKALENITLSMKGISVNAK